MTTSQGTVTTGNTTTPTADTSVVVAVGTVQPRDDRDDHIPRHGRGAVHRHRRRDRQPRHGRVRPSCPTSTPIIPDTPAPDDPTTTPIDADPVIVVEEGGHVHRTAQTQRHDQVHRHGREHRRCPGDRRRLHRHPRHQHDPRRRYRHDLRRVTLGNGGSDTSVAVRTWGCSAPVTR